MKCLISAVTSSVATWQIMEALSAGMIDGLCAAILFMALDAFIFGLSNVE